MTNQLARVWPEPAEEIRDEVVQFWLASGALSDLAAARERSGQLLVVGRDAHGNVTGVSTAVRILVDQLGFECFYYRTFIAPGARVRGLRSTQLVSQILHESYRLLDERFLHGFDRQGTSRCPSLRFTLRKGHAAKARTPSGIRCNSAISRTHP